jgi:hypothetical protein
LAGENVVILNSVVGFELIGLIKVFEILMDKVVFPGMENVVNDGILKTFVALL